MKYEIFSEIVGENLFDLVYYRQYPIHPGISKMCFIDSLLNLGAEVSCDDSKRTALITTKSFIDTKKIYKIKSEMSYNSLGEGNRLYPLNSIKSFEDSVYNLWQPEDVTLGEKYSKVLRNIGDKKQKEFKLTMRSFIVPYLEKYQENILIPLSGKIPSVKNPKITKNILRENPQIKPGSYFWAIYLDKLCYEKGYPLKNDNPKDRLEVLLKDGNLALEDGRRIWSVNY